MPRTRLIVESLNPKTVSHASEQEAHNLCTDDFRWHSYSCFPVVLSAPSTPSTPTGTSFSNPQAFMAKHTATEDAFDKPSDMKRKGEAKQGG